LRANATTDGGGHGANCDGDGLNHGNAPISTATIPPMEILEAAYPIMFRQWALRPDSSGAGKFQGGMGAIYEIEVLEKNGAEAFLFGERGKYPPQGIAGGKSAALNRCQYENNGEWQSPPMISKMRQVALKQGEAVRLETPGGGGFGNASERSSTNIANDVRLGLISESYADSIYGKLWRNNKHD